jgi:VPDSG-CTERM motif
MRIRLVLTIVAGLLGSAVMAQANTITVGVITHVSDGSGGELWTYPIIFNNSSVSAAQPTGFDLNDFGPLKTTGALPLGYTFTPGVAFTLTTPLVGPNFGLPGFQPNNPAAADVVVTFTANANMGAGTQTFNLVLDTALTGSGGRANFFSQDIVATGDLAGSPNAVQQNITTPSGVPVPDGGATAVLFFAALSGLGLLRRKLS